MTFVDWDDLARWKMIDIALSLGLAEPVETYSSSKHLYEMLDIPTDSTGRLTPEKKITAPAKPRTEKPAAKLRIKTERTRVRTKKFSA